MDYNNLFNYDNGFLFWREGQQGHARAGDLVGTLREDGYIGIVIRGKYCFAHRIIWEMFNGPIPVGLVVDHIDADRANCSIENLRICTFQENHFNRGKMSNNKSGFKGVSWHKQKSKWVAQIKIDGKNKFLGFFSDPEVAYEAYCKVAIERYGEYVKL